MKKLFLLVAALTAISFAFSAKIAAAEPPTEIKAVLHSGKNVLPDTPAIGSPIWLEDSIKYRLYKEPRLLDPNDENTENWDSVWAVMNEQYYFSIYRLGKNVINAQFITDVTWSKITTGNKKGQYTVSYTRNTTDFPEMNNLQQLCTDMKDYHTDLWRTRMRPYCYFNDWYKGKKYSRTKNPSMTSYPSGHGYFRGLFGKCMEIIDPAHNEAIQDTLDAWLHCRLQLGAHWSTDLDAGKMLGEIAFDSAMTVDVFRNQVFAAKEELKNYRLANSIPTSTQPEATDIDDGIETYIAGLQGNTTDLTIHRILYKDGYFNTICLPFSLTASEIAAGSLAGCELFEFVGAVKNDDNALELNIRPVSDIEAGHPYLIRWASGKNILSMTFNNVHITASAGQTVGSGDVQFVGMIGQTALTGGNENQLFLGSNNTLYWPESNSSLKGFRAYFLVSGEVASNHSPARLVIRPETPTGTDEVKSSGKKCKMIDNGRLVILVDGVKYNAQGQVIQ